MPGNMVQVQDDDTNCIPLQKSNKIKARTYINAMGLEGFSYHIEDKELYIKYDASFLKDLIQDELGSIYEITRIA